MTHIKPLRYYLMRLFARPYLRTCYRAMMCAMCDSKTDLLASAPGWFDVQQCSVCKIEWCQDRCADVVIYD
jgi:hypothetical protein